MKLPLSAFQQLELYLNEHNSPNLSKPFSTPYKNSTNTNMESDIDMETVYPTSDGSVPPQNSSVIVAAKVTAITHKFKNLEIRDSSTPADGDTIQDQMEITRQFKRLDISGGSCAHMDNNSAQTTAAGGSHYRPLAKPVHINFDLPIQQPAQPMELTSEPIGDSQDDSSDRCFADDGLDEWSESLAMRCAMHKEGKKRTRNARKRLFKGPIRNKNGGVSRHRHNTSRKSLVN